MNKWGKVLRDVVITICCLTTLCLGIGVAANFDHVQKIARTWNLINQKYLGDVDGDTLTNGVVKGMLDSLDDKYTTYIDEDVMTNFMQQVSGDVYGVGIYVAADENGELVILAPIEGSPAEEAGILAGDILRAVDGQRTAGMSLDNAVSMMRGSANTTVDITVARDGAAEEKTFTMKRYKLGTIKTVDGRMLEDDPSIAYLRISEFSLQTAKEFAEQINTLRSEHTVNGMVLDLRDNGGGEVNAAVEIARIFVPSGPIVHVVYADGRVDTKSATDAQLNLPLVVLVNGNTASASEILSGALKDSNIATLVGTQTFGKGLVQGVYLYNDGTAMKITEAKYLTPNQNDINGVGIRPDVTVELPKDATVDVQLEKAIEVLQGQMGEE